MDLQLDPSVAAQYKSPAQIARVVTEHWAKGNLYCVACQSGRVTSGPNNTPVCDYVCPECGAIYQLKSKNGRFGRVVTNSEYDQKVSAIRTGAVPHYIFLGYSIPAWTVNNLFVIPAHFISQSVIQRRNPLGPKARRAGWVGSNTLVGSLPAEARVSVVENGAVRPPHSVRSDWQKFELLGSDSRASGGWGAEILGCVRELHRETGDWEFTLQDFYSRFVGDLSLRHPENHNVEAKIRQQLQVVRAGKILEFLGRGQYRLIA